MMKINTTSGQMIKVVSRTDFSQIRQVDSAATLKSQEALARTDTIKISKGLNRDSVDRPAPLTYSDIKSRINQAPVEETPYQFRPADILSVIDHLNHPESSSGVDVNGDGTVRPTDLLAWIDAANASRR